jgi:hypothetical protein
MLSVQVLLTLALPSRQMLAVPSQRANQVPHQRLLLVPLHALATEVSRMNLKIRHYLLTGLLVWLPMGVTVWLLTWLVGTMDGIFLAVLGALDAVIPGMHSAAESLRHMPGLGVILVAVVIYFTGLFVTNIFGQWWLRQWSKVITRIPVVNSIYSSVKQVADTLFSGSGNAFSKALLVQYPHQGSWTIGPPLAQRLRQCVRPYHPQSNLRFLSHHAQSQCGGVGHDGRRRAQVHHLDGRGGARWTRRLACQNRTCPISLNWLKAN